MEITCDICGEPWPGPLVRVRDEAVAATAVSASRAVRRGRDNIGGTFRAGMMSSKRSAKRAHLRQYAVGGAL